MCKDYISGEMGLGRVWVMSEVKKANDRLHVRFIERRRDSSFASELESNFLDGSGLRECEQYMARQQCRFDVYGRAFEYKGIGVENNVNARLVRMWVMRFVSGLHIVVDPGECCVKSSTEMVVHRREMGRRGWTSESECHFGQDVP